MSKGLARPGTLAIAILMVVAVVGAGRLSGGGDQFAASVPKPTLLPGASVGLITQSPVPNPTPTAAARAQATPARGASIWTTPAEFAPPD